MSRSTTHDRTAAAGPTPVTGRDPPEGVDPSVDRVLLEARVAALEEALRRSERSRRQIISQYELQLAECQGKLADRPRTPLERLRSLARSLVRR